MKVSIRSFVLGLAIAAAGLFANPPSQALAGNTEFTVNSQSIQIIKGAQLMFLQPAQAANGSDTFNMKVDFTNNGDGSCDPADSDIIGNGITFAIAPGTCAQNYYNSFTWSIPSFVAKTVGGVKQGTYFAVNGTGTVVAKAITESAGGGCGRWNVQFQANKLDLCKIQHNPIALKITDHDGSETFCLDVSNALIGAGF